MGLSKPPQPPRPVTANVKVLIADDTQLLLEMLEKDLRELGITNIIRATDGDEALHQALELCPEVVFLDINMPRRNGLKVLKELKSKIPNLFVCMLSAHSSIQNVRAALSAGASGFLVKPIQRQRLAHVVDQFLRSK